jgi:hypothetical protein
MGGGLTCIGEFTSARAHWQQGIASTLPVIPRAILQEARTLLEASG